MEEKIDILVKEEREVNSSEVEWSGLVWFGESRLI